MEAGHKKPSVETFFHAACLTEGGARWVEHTHAVAINQMLHVHERRWATTQLAELAIPTDILLPLVMPGTVIGQVRLELAADAGLPAATPVIATGAHDTASAVASIPDLDERSAFISSGTWSLVGMEVHEPVVDETSRALNVSNEGGVGSSCRRWCASTVSRRPPSARAARCSPATRSSVHCGSTS